MYRIFGLDPQERSLLTYKEFLRHVHPEDRRLIQEASREALSGESRSSLDYRAVRPDGEVRFVHAQYEIEHDASGRVIDLVGTLQDVTELRRTEQALRQLGHQNELILNSTSEGLYELDLRGNTTFVNPAAAQMVGWEIEELVGQPQHEILHHSRADGTRYPREECPIYAALRDGRVHHASDEVFWRKDGTSFPVEYVSTPIWEDAELVGAVVNFSDTTERRRAEEESRKSEADLVEAQQIAHLGSWSVEPSNPETPQKKREMYWSDEMYRIFGFEPREFVSTSESPVELTHPEDREYVSRALEDSISRGEPSLTIEHRVLQPNGEVRFVQVQMENVLDDNGELLRRFGTVLDITDRKQAEEELRRSEERFRSLVQNASDIIMITGVSGDVSYISPAVEQVLGYKAEDVVSNHSFTPVHPDDMVRVRNITVEAMSRPGETLSFELRLQHVDGSWRHLESSCTSLLHDPTVNGIVFNSRDITERKAFEKQLEHQAFHDDLTGLPNRALLADRLEHALARADRTQQQVAILFLDLDNFKVINDSLGHEAGDELLIAVAERLQGYLRPADTAARLSGDEFVVLLEDVTEESEASRLAERLAEQLQVPFELGDQEVYVTPSIGIAFGASSDDRPDDLLRKADIAMYRAKSRGKARYEVFNVRMDAEARERLRLETELRQAIECEELRVYYQPKVILETGEIFDFEALVRWEHPQRGLVTPAEFIPIAEETGLIHQLGKWMLRESCRQAREWQEQKLSETPVKICVNLSAKQFQHPDLVQDVAQILQETGMDERLLCLEITESVMMDEAQSTIETLRVYPRTSS